MKTLRQGSQGEEVARWQGFLAGRGLLDGGQDGIFGVKTARATAAFQASQRLVTDSVVGSATLHVAAMRGFDDSSTVPAGPERIQPTEAGNDFFPLEPDFRPLVGDPARQAVFGRFSYVAAPSPSNPEAIRLTDDWAPKNIVSVTVPGLKGIPVAGTSTLSSGRMSFHRRGAAQLIALWQSWGNAGLLDRILTFDGGYNPRFQRNSHTALSNHAFGSAFDINAQWNPYRHAPAPSGKRGCVFALIALANEHGFYWGGHFAPNTDGMHFELAKVL